VQNLKTNQFMKKSIFILGVLATVAFVSCKKDYTCTCTYTSGGSSMTSTSTMTNVKKKDATEACETLATSGGATYSCTLD
jgi:hypothetical protein